MSGVPDWPKNNFKKNMSLISPVLDNHHQIRQSIRQREIVGATERISSGNRLNHSPSVDAGALRISQRLTSESKYSNSAKKNLDNAALLAQYQADVLYSADNILSRMNDLAYQATDMMSSKSHRQDLNTEFKALSGQLKDLMYDRTFDKVMLDPLSSTNIETIDLPPPDGGGDARKSVNLGEIGALSGKVKFWWNPWGLRDRFQIYVGGKRIFDTGEYQSYVGGNIRVDPNETDEDGNPVLGDYFEVDYGPNKINFTKSDTNVGNSGLDSEFIHSDYDHNSYPFTDSPDGNSSIFEYVVNDPGPEGITKSPSSLWDLKIQIEKQPVDGPVGIKNEQGELLQIEPVGFATLSSESIDSLSNASNALTKTQEEMESVQAQLYTLAKTFSEIQFQSERVASKSQSQQISLGRIQDTDTATEYTKLAKNLIVQEATNSAISHSKISAKNVFNLLV
jgi:flagellin-like hook-associated protein FlgL